MCQPLIKTNHFLFKLSQFTAVMVAVVSSNEVFVKKHPTVALVSNDNHDYFLGNQMYQLNLYLLGIQQGPICVPWTEQGEIGAHPVGCKNVSRWE